MSDTNNTEIQTKNCSFLTKILNNKYKIIIYILLTLIIVGGLTAIIMGSFIPINPETDAQRASLNRLEIPYINLVSYLCMSILGILLILYIISVVYSIINRGDNK